MEQAEENRRLRQRLRYLIKNQAHLEERLQRVENSMVFRCLQWIGGVFGAGNDKGLDDNAEYAAWTRETQVSCPSPAAVHSRISVILAVPDGRDLNPTISAIVAQRYPEWELYICSPSPLETTCEKSTMIAGENAFKTALDRIESPFVVIVGAGAILEPDAIQTWLAALEGDAGLTAVYSDWDLIDREGRRHSPRFTPEFSPELLASTPYWGSCFAARTDVVRKIGWPGEATDRERELTRRLAGSGGSIARIPRVLWHLADQCQSKPEPAEAVAANASSTASIIICSRNAKRLEACLASLAPTIDARHQVIVVAHETNGHDPELKRAAERHGAASIPYRGGFHFARMNELGASVAQGSVLVLMNDDVRPIATDWLETMLAQAARPEIGVVGAMLRYPSGAIQHAGIVIGDMLLPTHPGRSHRDSPYWPWLTMTREVSAVTGACLAVRRSVWNELGGFDKRFPVNYNDVDFCLRARRLGYRVLIETRAILIHEGASTRVPEVRASERELFWELWSDVLSAPDPYFNPQLEIRDETIRLPRAWPRQR